MARNNRRFSSPCSLFLTARLPGFSAVEILVVTAILISLAAIGVVTYRTTMHSIHVELSTNQEEEVVDHVARVTIAVKSGVESGLVAADGSSRINNDSTCSDYLQALKETMPDYRNPYDGSPAITFSSDYDIYHKRGKIRITCYKLHRYTPSNGGSCKMYDAGIRMTHFLYDCGGKCGSPKCTHPSLDCGDGPKVDGWVHGAQKDTFFGKVEARFVTTVDGEVLKFPWGDPMADTAYGESVCPGFKPDLIPKEADY